MKKLALLSLLIALPALGQGTPPPVSLGGSAGVTGSASFLGYISLTSMTNANYTLSPNEWWAGTIVVPSSLTLTAVRSITPPANAGQRFVLANLSTGGFAVTVNGISVANGSQQEFDYINGAYVAIGGSATVSAAAIQSALAGQAGCTTAGYLYSPQSNTCIAGGTVSTSANIYAANSQVQADSGGNGTYYGLDCFGDSYMAGYGATAPANGQCSLVGSDLNMPSPNNQAVPGDNSADLAYHVFTTLNPTASGNPMSIAAASDNNATGGSGGIPNFKQNYFAAFAWGAMASTQKVLIGSAGVSNTGTVATDTTFANANGKTCSSGPCTFSYSAVVGAPGAFYVWYIMRSTGGTISATVGGVAATDTVTSSASISTAWTVGPVNNSVTVGLARFVASAGSQSLVVTASAGATVIGFGFPTVARYRGATGPRMLMGGTAIAPFLTTPQATLYNTASLAVSQVLVADGLNVPFVDLFNAYNYNLDFQLSAMQNCPASTATNHPNDCGHRNAANAWEANLGAAASILNGPYGGPYSVSGPFYVNSAAAITNLNQSSSMQPHSYTDTVVGGLNLAPLNASMWAGPKWILNTTNTAEYDMTFTLSDTGKGVAFCWNTVLTSDSSANCPHLFHSDGSAYHSGKVTVNTPTAVGGAALTVNGLTSGNGWSNGANTTPIYNYSTVMGTQPGPANDEEVFTTSSGSVSLGQVASGSFTPWLKATSSGLAMQALKITGLANGSAATDAVALGQLPISAAITSAAPTSGITSATCISATCTNLRGSYTIVGGTFSGGTFLTLMWPTTTTAYVCHVDQNDTSGETTSFLSLGHSVATATGMTISSGVTLVSQTFNVDYSCQP